MNRTILHCDLNGFYASVECILNPALQSLPMAVAGNPETRHGIILAKNELAKKYNIKTAETIFVARKKCPNLVLVPPQHDEYVKYSRLVNEIYENFTDLVEPFGIDESWLDVTGVRNIFGSGEEIASKIRATVKKELGLTLSIGVSFNKAFAKLGSDYKKPDATTVITRENYKDIVFPLPVSTLLFVGEATGNILRKLYIKTIGDLAKSDKALLKSRLGKIGETIWNYANGMDDSPVKAASAGRDIKSVGNGMTFKRNLAGLDDVKLGVAVLADEVASRLRKYGLKCSTVQVMIKDPDFKSISRQKKLDTPTHLTGEISKTALVLIKDSWDLNKPIRTLTITGANLTSRNFAASQLSLFDNGDNLKKEKQEKLETAIDKIRDKYGKKAISLGCILKNDLGIEYHTEKE